LFFGGLPRSLRRQAGLDAFFQNRLPDRGAGGGRQRVKQPVVAEGHRGGHLGGVEEVRGIPIRERGDREHFLLCLIQKNFLTRQPVGEA